MLKLVVKKSAIDQTWSIAKICSEFPPFGWEHVFESAKDEIQEISDILEKDEVTYGTFYPLKQDIFNAFNQTSLNSVKLVLIGQDPYHKTISINGVSMPQATGLSFSTRREDNVPGSLINVYKELEATIPDCKIPDHGNLLEWAHQGVLLLNSCLTVRPGKPDSHGSLWLGFINRILKAISAVNPTCVYLLWGKKAQKLKSMLGEKSVILEAAHPSGLNNARGGFLGCNHFKLANEILVKQGKVGIKWRITSNQELREREEKRRLESKGINMPVVANLPQAVLPQAILPQAILPQNFLPQAILPSSHSNVSNLSQAITLAKDGLQTVTPILPLIENKSEIAPPIPVINFGN